jgi:hypothetical protein
MSEQAPAGIIRRRNRRRTTSMAKLDWKVAEGVSTVPKEHCFEADVANGMYRVAPWLHVDRSIHYEAFFIPTGAESMADVRDINTECCSIADAKAIAQRDYDQIASTESDDRPTVRVNITTFEHPDCTRIEIVLTGNEDSRALTKAAVLRAIDRLKGEPDEM